MFDGHDFFVPLAGKKETKTLGHAKMIFLLEIKGVFQ